MRNGGVAVAGQPAAGKPLLAWMSACSCSTCRHPCALSDSLPPAPPAPAAEITINTGNMRPEMRSEWDELKQHDVLFLLTIRPPDSITANYMAQVWQRGGVGVGCLEGFAR